MQSAINLNERRDTINAELLSFNVRVRPMYADMCSDLWDALFEPLERLANYFQRSNTTKLVEAFEAKYQSK